MKKYMVIVDKEATMVDEYMEEAYVYVKIKDVESNKIVGIFQTITDEILDEDVLIKHYETLTPSFYMVRPLLSQEPKIIQDLHEEHMSSSNSNIYGEDMKDWLDTEEEYGMTWEEYESWLKDYASKHPEFDRALGWDNSNFWMGWDFLFNYNLLDERPKCPHCKKIMEQILVHSGDQKVFKWNSTTKKYEEEQDDETITRNYCIHCGVEVNTIMSDTDEKQNIELELE